MKEDFDNVQSVLDKWFKEDFFSKYKIADEIEKNRLIKAGRVHVQRYYRKHFVPLNKRMLTQRIASLQEKHTEGLGQFWIKGDIENLKLERDFLDMHTSPKREIEMRQAYSMVKTTIRFKLLETGSYSTTFHDAIEMLEAEYEILKGLFLSTYKNPDRKQNAFFYKIDFKKWEKALLFGGVVYVYATIKRLDLLFIKSIKLSPELARLLGAAVAYGMNPTQAFNYARYVYANNICKAEIISSYKKLQNNLSPKLKLPLT